MPNYIVRLKSKAAFDKCCQHLHTEKCKHKKISSLNAISLSTPINNQEISQLIDPSLVQRIEKDITITLTPINSSKTSSVQQSKNPWGMRRIGANYSRIPSRYPRPKVAIMDTGLSKHPALNISDQYINFTDERSAIDLNGHGTHIAGTIGGFSRKNRRKNNFHGVYPNIPLLAVKTFTKDGSASLSSILQGIEWCIENDIRIINMSFGISEHQQSLQDAVRLAHQKGILMVAASGNNGRYGLDYPARYPEVISVGSINQNNQVSNFSQFGPRLDIVAPGEEIFSTWLNNSYDTISGTSMACGHVSGALALILTAKPNITRTQARQILLTNTERLLTSPLAQGNGLLSVNKIIDALQK